MTQATDERGFTFPSTLEVTVMGAADENLDVFVPEMLREAGVSVVADSLRARASREGRYLSVSIAFICPDRETYDDVHRRLREHPAVKWTL